MKFSSWFSIVSLLLITLNGCSDESYIPIVEKYSEDELETKGDGWGLRDGMTYGLQDRNDFEASKVLLEDRGIDLNPDNLEEIMSELGGMTLYQTFYDSFPSEKQADNYIAEHKHQGMMYIYKENLGEEFISTYISGFEEGYIDSFNATEQEAEAYQEMLNDSEQ
ncbi:hypothetical protein [Peribacillus frigoritolerans]|uniref:hypothetical protein n=1 Tax=Peribacillus frigoritolerans TaxID=450367 RepID=UPI0021A670D2|nr:hypothetical protein [Peribacillus frigoritolerans]MCT1390152.1 hypothetical protein [Peribacillus frigoritolerans]MEE3955741.1 hypothetical protein [Peribacillus frigoritolerans]